MRAEAYELAQLPAELASMIHPGEDQVLFIDVGPVEGHGSTSLTAIGRPYTHPESMVIVA